MESASLRASKAAVFAALVLASTMVVNVYVPATKGYFNLGETMIYLAALFTDPFTAAFAGGVGSALADVILGYSIYAPATLVIKALEGGVAAFLVRRLRRGRGELYLLSLATTAAYFVIVLAVGYTIFSGNVELTLSGYVTLKGFLTPALWIFIAALAVSTPIYLLVRSREEVGSMILSLLLAGGIMILGYFLYEQLILGYYALAEVPVNFGQVVLGIALAIPVYAVLKGSRGKTASHRV
ncbi:MAG: ECF transporter S component [Thaumarchaeota archaeon]|nr:ECF transporter S component [Nitrososphaerota archaeon]